MLNIFLATNTLDNYELPFKITQNKALAEIVVIGGKPINLNEFPSLKGIFKTGVGVDNLPFAEALEKGVRIQLPSEETKDIIYDETASFTCFLILNGLYHSVGDVNAWKKNARNSLTQKRLLVMGTGRIGGRVARKMQTFMQVETYDPLQNNLDELNFLLKKADCVSLHMPLDSSTKNFFDKDRLALIKDSALLVNTSRGSIVNEEALFDELVSGRIRAAFDVFWEEPYLGKLLNLSQDQFFKTPHVASTCNEFLQGLVMDLILLGEELEGKI